MPVKSTKTSHVSKYYIEVTNRDSGIFWAGEKVEGVVKLVTTSDIKCRSVNTTLECKSSVKWHLGHGQDSRIDYIGKRDYVLKKMTPFGNFYHTSLLNEAGSNAYWDVSTCAGEISMLVAGPSSEKRNDKEEIKDMTSSSWHIDNLTLAFRVMEYEKGKKDELIGEVLVKVKNDLLCNPGMKKSYHLISNSSHGGDSHGSHSFGEITISAILKEANINTTLKESSSSNHASKSNNYNHMLTLIVHQATGLKSVTGLFGGKNNVYVQCYKIPPNTPNPSIKHLPIYNKTKLLPAGEYEFPFSFQIPNHNMPPSFECNVEDRSFIRWSIHSNIDIKFNKKTDPSCRKYVTILNADMPPKYMLRPVMRAPQEPKIIYLCDGSSCYSSILPICNMFHCIHEGHAYFKAGVDKQIGASGDNIHLTLDAYNNTSHMHAKVTVKLIMICKLFTKAIPSRNMKSHYIEKTREWLLHSEPLPPQGKILWTPSDPKVLTVPVCPSSYSGKDGDTTWTKFDPLTWRYYLEIKLDMISKLATDITWLLPFHICSLPVEKLQCLYPNLSSYLAKKPKMLEDLPEDVNTSKSGYANYTTEVEHTSEDTPEDTPENTPSSTPASTSSSTDANNTPSGSTQDIDDESVLPVHSPLLMDYITSNEVTEHNELHPSSKLAFEEVENDQDDNVEQAVDKEIDQQQTGDVEFTNVTKKNVESTSPDAVGNNEPPMTESIER